MDLLNGQDIEGALLLRYINNKVNSEERAVVDRWISENESNNEVLRQIIYINHAQQTRLRILQRDPNKALLRVNRRLVKRFRQAVIRRVAVALSFLIGIIGISSVMWQHRSDDMASQRITVTTNAGMRSHLILPDSSFVFLNAGSQLEYPSKFSKNERRVQLSGEAYFIIAKNAKQSFWVSVAERKVHVQATGTEFNIQAYQKEGLVQVTLIEGSLQLSIQGKKEIIHLSPSEMITYNVLSDQLVLKKINIAQITAWKEGCLIFKDTPMPEVLRQITHFYSVDIDVHDDLIRDYVFTGTFENRPLFQILDYMKISSKIDYSMLYPENQEIRKPLIIFKKDNN